MWKDNLDKIVTEKKMYNEQVNSGATNKEIEALESAFELNFRITIPGEYKSFLSVINGFEFNGFILYGIDRYITKTACNQPVTGLLESNKIWYENQEEKKYVFLGESSISWYVFNVKDATYAVIDNPSGVVIVVYNDLSRLLVNVLSDALI